MVANVSIETDIETDIETLTYGGFNWEFPAKPTLLQKTKRQWFTNQRVSLLLPQYLVSNTDRLSCRASCTDVCLDKLKAIIVYCQLEYRDNAALIRKSRNNY